MSSTTQHPRILHLISRLDGYGGARLLRSLVAQQAAEGAQPRVAALSVERWAVDELRMAGARVSVLNARWAADPVAALRLHRLLRRESIAAIHAWDSAAAMWIVIAPRSLRRIAAWDSPEKLPRWASSIFGMSATPIPRGVGAQPAITSNRLQLLAELALPADARLIAMAGPLGRRKEYDEAIWCFELVRVLHPKARLVLFGDGPDRARLERYAALVSDPDCVRFAGFRHDVRQLLPHVDVFWQLDPAAITPYALLEAMAAGVPVVASNVSSHREAVTSDATGRLVPLRSRADVARASDELLSDPALARAIGTAAAADVQRRWPLEASLAACRALHER